MRLIILAYSYDLPANDIISSSGEKLYMQKLLGVATATLVFTLGVSAQVAPVAPTFTKGFFQGLGNTPQTTLPADSTTTATLRFTITNTNVGTGLTDIAFTDTLPAGLQIANPNGLLGTCGPGVIVATAGSTSISLTGGVLQPSGSVGDNCSFVVNVVGITPSVNNNVAGPITATALRTPLTGGTAAASITVLALNAPVLSKSFSVPFIGVGGTASLIFQVFNPNTVPLSGLAFSDTLPVGLILAAPNGIVTCSGTIVAVAGSNLVSLSAGTLGANTVCAIVVQVMATAPGVLVNTTSTITATNATAGAAATATIVAIPLESFQVRYASNLAVGDSVVNITNTGASSSVAFPTQNGNICVNAYAFSPDEQLISCCTCLVTPDGLVSLSARNDLISNTLTPGVPTSIVVKLIASSGTVVGGATTCNASTVTPASIATAAGLSAWGTTIHAAPVTPGTPAGTFGITETRFTPATLSAAELLRVTSLCGFIQNNGSGFGQCKSCRLGGLGADRQ